MARGYAQHWPKSFLSQTAYCSSTSTEGSIFIEGQTTNDARWDLSDALSFKELPHFKLPGDRKLTEQAIHSLPTVQVELGTPPNDDVALKIESSVDIARIKFNGAEEPQPTVSVPQQTLYYMLNDLERRFDRSQPLKLEVLSMNGKTKVIGNAWKIFSSSSFIRIPGSSVVLNKKSIASNDREASDDEHRKFWEWAVLLNEKGGDGKCQYLLPNIEQIDADR